ncbi:hypothetical protein Q73A0000_09435 [Kaistella flava (ex Peng et al. 2021)]|uniref:Uncharacterized protein n=1 Tax=Kaistella flava (ex Peng et al. 2021) TaxID=2038776 RepID=A0A7M2Y9S6_9FLAO|nr:hypothetical protein [Kaistella flava (ex Peng et al. 2021)]QOW10579.1 hypothetical protein Q73A0000_09435 [Kaistella flava (ex Peng et al. 2021)]
MNQNYFTFKNSWMILLLLISSFSFGQTTEVPINNNYASYTHGVSGEAGNTVGENNGPLILTAPAGSVFINVRFASYGSPSGTYPDFLIGSCHATNSRTVTTGLLGNTTAKIPASGSFNETFGDPCSGTLKTYDVAATYTEPFCSNSAPEITITGSTPTGGNGITYTYLWEMSTTNATTGYGSVSGINNAKDYLVPPGTKQTTWYRRTVTSGTESDATIVIVQVTGAPVAPASFTAEVNNQGNTTLSVNGVRWE